MTPRRRRAGGFTLIELIVVVTIIGILIALLLPAVQAAREASRRAHCISNLKQIGIGLHNYETSFGSYPFGVGSDFDKAFSSVASPQNRRYSLHSQLLLMIEQAALFHALNFAVAPFDPDDTGDPRVITGRGANETAATVRLAVFLCPSDYDRMPSVPWGPTNYRSCNGGSWSGRGGDGLFGQGTRTRPGDVRDGLSNTAAFGERVRGHDDFKRLDLLSDVIRKAAPWTEQTFRDWCMNLSDAEAASIYQPRPYSANSGQTWLEGNMSWTRYNHLLPPGRKSCINKLTWHGVAMSANSRHPGGVNMLLADGSVRFIKDSIDPATWQAAGTIAGGEAISGLD